MKYANFYEYIGNGFIPRQNEHIIPKPVISFTDRHSSHLTVQVSTLCENSEIMMNVLPPNTTHTLQHADGWPFKALKQFCRDEVRKYQRENVNEIVRDVAPLTKNVLGSSRLSIKNGLRAAGLDPLNPDFQNYAKYLEIEETQQSQARRTPPVMPPPMMDQE